MINLNKNPVHIAATQYTSSTRSLDLYVSGCIAEPHCDGCHNSELFEFGHGEIINDEYINKIIEKIKDFDLLIENIFLYGGEPLDQNLEIVSYLLKRIKDETKKTIWLFTRYELNKISQDIKNIVDYIKCGRYLKKYLKDDYFMYGIKLATSNQAIFKKDKDF